MIDDIKYALIRGLKVFAIFFVIASLGFAALYLIDIGLWYLSLVPMYLIMAFLIFVGERTLWY